MTAQAGTEKRTAGPQSLKIDIVVHGRFHAFELANSLRALGHDVLVHTNYPKLIAARFGLPADCIRSCLSHGLLSRSFDRIGRWAPKSVGDRVLHTAFGTWAARGIRPEADIVHGFSGVMEETLQLPARSVARQLRTIVRGSAHIREQARLLLEEEQRVGVPIDRPSEWMIAREEREYALADRIIVLSTFAHESFVAGGVPRERLLVNPLGVDMDRFRVAGDDAAERKRRILSGAPLRVLSVGTFSYRKGAHDLERMARALNGRMQFRFVGNRPEETRELCLLAAPVMDFVDRVSEDSLPEQYAWGDVFVFPTIEDGFAAVILQAAAGGLPVLATGNCAAPDCIVEGKTGWVLPIRNGEAFIERLIWCDEHRAELAAMSQAAPACAHNRQWSVAADELATLLGQK